jgi:hypothetical protein
MCSLQGVSELHQEVLTRALAYGAGRYTHVLFPGGKKNKK